MREGTITTANVEELNQEQRAKVIERDATPPTKKQLKLALLALVQLANEYRKAGRYSDAATIIDAAMLLEARIKEEVKE